MNKITIGRNNNCNIVIPEKYENASRNHADIIVVNGQIRLTDHSTNGTRVNGNVINQRSIIINEGDSIMFGSYPLNWNELKNFIYKNNDTVNHFGRETQLFRQETQNLGDKTQNYEQHNQPFVNEVDNSKTSSFEKQDDSEEQNKRIRTEISKFNWGAFGLYPIWGFYNGMWWLVFLNLLMYIPVVGIIICIVLQVLLGIKGSEWSWKNKKWNSIDEFVRVQSTWKPWGIVLFILSFLFSFFTNLAI